MPHDNSSSREAAGALKSPRLLYAAWSSQLPLRRYVFVTRKIPQLDNRREEHSGTFAMSESVKCNGSAF